ncbi:hypothetical protein CDN99_07625 [Roseateles aquatilis]|uniref:Uncharacterized protein n=1 Tax=Roseateles aquatilis TaxID=431061 RepID=A0A246JHW7_9BURK|nr:hypothetical protein [Roseateles aquatilis]OWQ92201.1 hypothetical protein CDN99_07625 [Roseateles aquatilis]
MNNFPLTSYDPLASAFRDALEGAEALPSAGRPGTDPLDACLSGDLPPGRLPRLSRERGAGAGRPPHDSNADLSTVSRYFSQLAKDRSGMHVALPRLIEHLRSDLGLRQRPDPALPAMLLKAGRELSICMDAREALFTMHLNLSEFRNRIRLPFAERLERFEARLKQIDIELGDAGLYAPAADKGIAGAIQDFCGRTARVLAQTDSALKGGLSLNEIVKASSTHADALGTTLLDYEAAIRNSLGPSAIIAEQAEQREAMVARFDALRPQLLARGGTLAQIRSELFAASAARAVAPPVPATGGMIDLDPPSFDDPEEGEDGPVSPTDSGELWERGFH